MPTVHREAGLRFVIYPNDHRPPHVHVFRAGTEAVIHIGDDDHVPTVRERKGLDARDVVRAVLIVDQRQAMFLAEWRRIHGG